MSRWWGLVGKEARWIIDMTKWYNFNERNRVVALCGQVLSSVQYEGEEDFKKFGKIRVICDQ